jgi:hypothetical protein
MYNLEDQINNAVANMPKPPKAPKKGKKANTDAKGNRATVQAKGTAPSEQEVRFFRALMALVGGLSRLTDANGNKIHGINAASMPDDPSFKPGIWIRHLMNLAKGTSKKKLTKDKVWLAFQQVKRGLAAHGLDLEGYKLNDGGLTMQINGQNPADFLNGRGSSQPVSQPVPTPVPPAPTVPVSEEPELPFEALAAEPAKAETAPAQTEGLSLTDLAIAKLEEVGEANLNANQKRIIAALLG